MACRLAPIVLQLTSGGQQTITLTQPNMQGVEELQLTGYQFTGVPVPAGIPYSLAFYIALSGPTFNCESISSNNGTAIGGLSGIPVQLNASFTDYIYDPPRLLARRSGMTTLPGSSYIVADVRDDTGAYAQFTSGRVYINAVYTTTGFPDITRSVTRNHDMTFEEHVGKVGKSVVASFK